MASGSHSEREVAAASEAPLVTVTQTARELKEADLWLRTGRGRREAHVTETHLVNLLLAIATGTPSKAAENVKLYRGLPAYSHLRTAYDFATPQGARAHIATTERDLEGRLFSGGSLGADLDIFVRWLADPKHAEDVAKLHQHGAEVTITTGKRPHAQILCRNMLSDGYDRITEYGQRPEALLGKQSSAIRHTAVIELPLLECLAALWRSSAERTGTAAPPSPSGSTSLAGDTPGNENAALAGAALRQPRANAANVPWTGQWHLIPEAGREARFARGIPHHLDRGCHVTHDPCSPSA